MTDRTGTNSPAAAKSTKNLNVNDTSCRTTVLESEINSPAKPAKNVDVQNCRAALASEARVGRPSGAVSSAKAKEGPSSLGVANTNSHVIVSEDRPIPDDVSEAGSDAGTLEDDPIDEKLHGTLEDYLTLFFGTKQLTQKDDMIQPMASHWVQCIFDEACDSMGCIPLPKGSSSDQQEAELDLLYSILYAVLTHLTSTHSDKKQWIRTIRFRISSVSVQKNERKLLLKRTQEKGDNDGKDVDEEATTWNCSISVNFS